MKSYGLEKRVVLELNDRWYGQLFQSLDKGENFREQLFGRGGFIDNIVFEGSFYCEG